jgi:alpha-L-rhamnosidase
MKDSFWSTAPPVADAYVLFRGHFRVASQSPVEFRVVGSSWYQAWLDGQPLLEGPVRFAPERPEYQSLSVELAAGDHVLAFHAHHLGVETRLLKDMPPFLWCEVLAVQARLPVDWRCLVLESQSAKTRRINPQLGWIEWRDTRLEPEGWEEPGFDDAGWSRPFLNASELPDPVAADLAPLRTFPHRLQPVAEGPLATVFGYVADEPAYIFHARDRVCHELPVTGVWRRYDLGRVRLGRPSLTLDLPAGTIVELALAEHLTEGRVSPYITFSAGTSCNLDRFVARGGEQVFCPLTPKGGRFLEVHVVNARDNVRFLDEQFLERGYHAPTDAAFSCGDPLLETVWAVGVETYRACAEDAITDNPTRERGQWVGDVASVGMEIASVAYHDLRLCRRALVQAAQCPREDGLVAGMSPGGCIYLPTYAFQWVVAVMNYFRHTGDRSALAELWPAARRNMEAIRAFRHEDGLHAVAGWNFVDWGYKTEDGPVDTACNLHYLWSLRGMAAWARALGHDASPWEAQAGELSALLEARIAAKLNAGGWDAVGYHCATLAMQLGLVADEPDCLDFLARHLVNCFPNDPSAPRNDDPTGFNARLITPYFAHYVMPLFIERGRMDFVLEQFRRCWGGFMLANGRTTWLEVFDTRWSHCHQWSGCPTWQLSRYLLGLHPRFDLGPAHFHFRLEPGSLSHAAGRLPHPDGGWIDIEWQRKGATVVYSCRPDSGLVLHHTDGTNVSIKPRQKARWSIETAKTESILHMEALS